MKTNHQGVNPVLLFTLIVILGMFGVFTGLLFLTRNRTEKGRERIKIISRTQIVYYLEYQKFAHNLQELKLNQSDKTQNYQYSIQIEEKLYLCGAAFKHDVVHNYAIPQRSNIYDLFQKQKLKSYVASIFVDCESDKEAPLVTIICENLKPGNYQPATPTIDENIPQCGAGTKEIDRY